MKLGKKWTGMRRALLVTAIGTLLGVGAGAGAYSAFAAHSGARDDGPRPAIGPIPADVNGDGIISDQGAERIPALISAVGDHGVAGYVRYSDLYGTPAPSSPEAALAEQTQTRVIPIYAADGVTVVDTLTAAPAHGVVEKTAPTATSPGGP